MTLPRRFNAAVIALAATLAISTAPPAQAQEGSPPAGCTGPVGATWLNIVAEGLRNSRGLLAITLYQDIQHKFLAHHGSLYVGRVDAVQGTTRACIFVPHPGVYVIALYHDENANQKFDRTAFGLPAEGYGFSNNPSTLAGLPSFRSVRLSVPRTGLTTRIQMHYP